VNNRNKPIKEIRNSNKWVNKLVILKAKLNLRRKRQKSKSVKNLKAKKINKKRSISVLKRVSKVKMKDRYFCSSHAKAEENIECLIINLFKCRKISKTYISYINIKNTREQNSL
jgi:hypothetical protein